MRTPKHSLIAALWIASLLVSAPAQNRDRLPRLSGARLLTGLNRLFITTPSETIEILDKEHYFVGASMSGDGKTIVAVRGRTEHLTGPVEVSTYSLLTGLWTKRSEQITTGISTPAISHDGSRLAFAMSKGSEPLRLHVMDLNTEAETIGRELQDVSSGLRMSWSPEGRHIAIGMHDIQVVSLDTGATATIAHGDSPAWSPSGEWIAFFERGQKRTLRNGTIVEHPAPFRLCIVHPDGSGLKVLFTLPEHDGFDGVPLWSSDSKTILLNKVHNEDTSTMDIYLFDVAKSRPTKKFRNGPAVYGWAALQ